MRWAWSIPRLCEVRRDGRGRGLVAGQFLANLPPGIAFDFQDDLWSQAEYLLDRLNPDVDGAGLLRPLYFDTGDDQLLQRRSAVEVAQSSIGAEAGCTTGNSNTPFPTRSEPLRSAQLHLFRIG